LNGITPANSVFLNVLNVKKFTAANNVNQTIPLTIVFTSTSSSAKNLAQAY